MTRAGFLGSPGWPAEKCPWSSWADAGRGIAICVARIAGVAVSKRPTAATRPVSFGMATSSMSLVVASRLDCLGPGIGLGGGAVSAGRWGGCGFDLVRDRALRVLVVARILVIVGRKAFADLHQRKHAAHLDGPELPEARHHRQGVLRQRHFHSTHLSHARAPHRHVVGHELADLSRHIALVDADEVL